jgi:hypothetical protein
MEIVLLYLFVSFMIILTFLIDYLILKVEKYLALTRPNMVIILLNTISVLILQNRPIRILYLVDKSV